jgi:succinylglutamate desuccinylase
MSFRLVRLVSHALALASFAITILAGPPAAAEDERYVDQNFGFSFTKPHFTPSEEKNVSTVAITLAGSQVGSFAPNVNVVVQNLETTLDAYEQLQREELKAVGWELLE